jgi:hypothetical protein
MGTFWRNPRTQQERRANSSTEYRRLEIQVGSEILNITVRIRGRRCLGMLVHAYRDLPRRAQRSWKKHRRTQWKVHPTNPREPLTVEASRRTFSP